MYGLEQIKEMNGNEPETPTLPSTPEEAIEDKRWLKAALHTTLTALQLIEAMPASEAKKIAMTCRDGVSRWRVAMAGVTEDDETEDGGESNETQAAQ